MLNLTGLKVGPREKGVWNISNVWHWRWQDDRNKRAMVQKSL
jgi:hypothetical protein